MNIQAKSLLQSKTYNMLAPLSFILFLHPGNVLAETVTLAWNASSGPVHGYRLYYGKSSRNYTSSLDVGNFTTCTLEVADDTITYFAVKAYDSARNESGFSNEVHNRLIIKGSFSGDSNVDPVWQPPRCQRVPWFMKGVTRTGYHSLGGGAVTWDIAGVGDFNGDSNIDLVWQHRATGQRALWFMNGATRTGSIGLGSIDVNWDIAGAGDFNHDGNADLVWQHRATGQRALWFMNGATRIGSTSLGVIDVNWDITSVGDVNRDGNADLVWQHRATGQQALWFMNGATRAGLVSLGSGVDANQDIVLH